MMVSMETRTITDVDFFLQLGADIGNWYNEAVEVQSLFPDLSLMRFRQVIEALCKQMAHATNVNLFNSDNLYESIVALNQAGIISKLVAGKLHQVRIAANRRVHAKDNEGDKRVSKDIAIKVRDIIVSLLADIGPVLYPNEGGYTFTPKTIKTRERDEMISKGLNSLEAKDKFLAGLAFQANADDYAGSLSDLVLTEKQRVHVGSLTASAARFLKSAIEIDAELDDIPIPHWATPEKYNSIVYSRAKVEYLYNFALIAYDLDEQYGFRRDAERAIQAAADKGHLPSIAMLGVHKYRSRDYKEAYTLLTKAAGVGELTALRYLYFYFVEGEACEVDEEEAKKYIQKAIELGCVTSMYQYGIDLDSGLKLNKNKSQAMYYLQCAADSGYVPAKQYLSMGGVEGFTSAMQQQFIELISAMDSKNNHNKNSSTFTRVNKIGVNELCPCGSGRKYKKCCKKNGM